jgi:hypothetical protein
VKPEGSDKWEFPRSGILDSPSGAPDEPQPSLRAAAERVAAHLMNTGSSASTTSWYTPPDPDRDARWAAERAAAAEALRKLTPKQKRAIRKGEKNEVKQAVIDPDEVPPYLHFVGNAPMGVLYGQGREGGERTFLMRAYVIDHDVLDSCGYPESVERVLEKTGEYGWYSKREIIEGKMVTDEENELEYLEYLLENIHDCS